MSWSGTPLEKITRSPRAVRRRRSERSEGEALEFGVQREVFGALWRTWVDAMLDTVAQPVEIGRVAEVAFPLYAVLCLELWREAAEMRLGVRAAEGWVVSGLEAAMRGEVSQREQFRHGG